MPEELLAVGSYSTVFEANLVRGKLESRGLHAVLKDDNMVSVNPLLTNLLGNVKVMVPQSEAGQAQRILESS